MGFVVGEEAEMPWTRVHAFSESFPWQEGADNFCNWPLASFRGRATIRSQIRRKCGL